MNNEELQTIAQNIGKNYNYPNVEAAFAEVRDFKVTWQRSYQWISLKVSDYMQDAPEVIISELLDTIFAMSRHDNHIIPSLLKSFRLFLEHDFRSSTYMRIIKCIN